MCNRHYQRLLRHGDPTLGRSEDGASVADRFERFVTRRGVDECWEWEGTRSPSGYGAIRDGDRMLKAHRVAYELFVGPIVDGLFVLHSCDNPPCVNPRHLHTGTHLQNMLEKIDRGRDHNVAKTHCPQGHPYSGANLYVGPDGKRQCRECRREASRRSRRKAARSSTRTG